MLTKQSPLLCCFLALEFFLFQFAPVGWAKKIEVFDPKKVSVAVLPYPASTSDRPFVEETAEAIRKDLKKIPYFHVVAPDTARSLVNYHSDFVRKGGTLTDAERYLGMAKTHWFDREYDEALAVVDRAISSFEKQPEKGDLLVDALLTKAMIYQETNRSGESGAIFKRVLAVNPSMSMEGMPIVGRSRKVFNDTKKEALERHSGNLEIKTNPPAATIYLNGINKGVTPLDLTGLPEGSYLMTIEASHYERVSEPVMVTANTTQFIERRLQWSGPGTKLKDFGVQAKSKENLQNEIKMAVQIGETLKVDKVILVASQKKDGEPLLVVRTIDTAMKSAYNPIGMPIAEFLKDKELSAQKVAGDIDDQAKLRVLDNPAEHIEPNMGDIRVLRRKLAFYKKPLFYSLVGAVVGGAIGATVGVIATRGGGSSSSGDEGGIDIEFE